MVQNDRVGRRHESSSPFEGVWQVLTSADYRVDKFDTTQLGCRPDPAEAARAAAPAGMTREHGAELSRL
jgi:hypothetical protein